MADSRPDPQVPRDAIPPRPERQKTREEMVIEAKAIAQQAVPPTEVQVVLVRGDGMEIRAIDAAVEVVKVG